MIRNAFIFLLFFCFIACQDSYGGQPSPKPTNHYLKNYNFTVDWFTYNIPLWEKALLSFKGKPNLYYLEIGVCEGRAAIWMLENILTDPSSRLTGIDTFPEGTGRKERYLSNLSISGSAYKATTIKGPSQIELRKLPFNAFDIIYIDGCHRADCVLADAVLCFELLKTDGLLIFDDYAWGTEEFPEELRPEIAIDSFITAYRNYVEVVHHVGNQVIIKKRIPYAQYFPLPPAGWSPVGQYVYVWAYAGWGKKSVLYHQKMGETIELSDKERVLIERLIRSTKFGKTKLFLDKKMSEGEDFINLIERLKLDFTNIQMEQ